LRRRKTWHEPEWNGTTPPVIPLKSEKLEAEEVGRGREGLRITLFGKRPEGNWVPLPGKPINYSVFPRKGRIYPGIFIKELKGKVGRL